MAGKEPCSRVGNKDRKCCKAANFYHHSTGYLLGSKRESDGSDDTGDKPMAADKIEYFPDVRLHDG